MLGWEFPPFISGGLGAACYGLTRAMSRTGTQILFVLPRSLPGAYSSHVHLLTPDTPTHGHETTEERLPDTSPPAADQVRFFPVPSTLKPYARPGPQTESATVAVRHGAQVSGGGPGEDYGPELFADVQRYTRLVCRLARELEFDVVHAHDWMTYPAGMRIAALTGKPLVVHVHSTEFDRSGPEVNPYIYRIELAGMQRARAVITVSYLTRSVVTGKYGIAPQKVHVVYNAIDANGRNLPPRLSPAYRDGKVVLFLGRMTMQKGPEYFVAAARKVLEIRDDVRFIMAGSGDLLGRTMTMARELGMSDRVVFPGFLRGREVDRVYRTADVYVMPSVSEPFGLVALEALSHGVPTIVSRQSGVAEVLDHVLKVDYWDVAGIADRIAAVLGEPALQASLGEGGRYELGKLSWSEAARRCLAVYQAVLNR